jgi:hypothetical protein
MAGQEACEASRRGRRVPRARRVKEYHRGVTNRSTWASRGPQYEPSGVGIPPASVRVAVAVTVRAVKPAASEGPWRAVWPQGDPSAGGAVDQLGHGATSPGAWHGHWQRMPQNSHTP